MTSIDVMDLTKISRNFPPTPTPEISKESFLDTLICNFESIPMVIVEGQDGIGKTNLLSQFCRLYPEQAISLFINPITHSSYNPELIALELLNQAKWILTRKEIESVEDLDIKTQWGITKWELQKWARKNRRKIYFVIDGLAEIPNDEIKYRDMILELLPFGEGNEFRFLMSGDESVYALGYTEKIEKKPFSMSGYTIDEAFNVLASTKFSREEIKDLYQISKLPSFFASIQRIMATGVEHQDLLDNLGNNYSNVLDIEWKCVDETNSEELNLLSFLAFSKVDFTIEELSTIAEIKKERITQIITKISFISFFEKENTVRFINEALRRYAHQKLFVNKKKIEEKIIDYLRTTPDNKRAISMLPVLYSDSERYNELIAHLTPENFRIMLESDESLLPLRETAKLGVRAALYLSRDSDLVGLGIFSSIIQTLYSTNVLESEIGALIALQQTDKALALIEQTSTKEDRLYLLAILSNTQLNMKADIQGLDLRIESLYKQIDVASLGDKAIDIASNLLNGYPDLAFDLVEKSTMSDKSENALDFAFIKLSLKALENIEDENQSTDILERIQGKIKNPSIKKFSSNSIAFLSLSPKRIIQEVEQVEKASEKLYLLRSWITKNREIEGIEEVIELSLRTAINTTDYSPNARDYREIASAIPFLKDLDKVAKFINILDGQKGTVENLGPTEEYVRLLLILATAEIRIDKEMCRSRIIDAYLIIHYLEDLSTKCSCLGRIAATINDIDKQKEFEKKDSLHSIIETELKDNLDLLLKKTADQYESTKGIIKALARSDPENTLSLTQELNSEYRRNVALKDFLRTYLLLPENCIEFSILIKAISKFTILSEKEKGFLEIFSRVNSFSVLSKEKESTYLTFLNEVENLAGPVEKCNIYSLFLESYERISEIKNQDIVESYFAKLFLCWEQIDAGWVKLDIAYRIIEAISSYKDKANAFLLKIDSFRKSQLFETDTTAISYIACIKLSVRALSGLFDKNLFSFSDIEKICRFIHDFPSPVERVGLYTDLALTLKNAKKDVEFKRIVQDKIRSEIDEIPIEEIGSRTLSIMASAPALYMCHAASANSLIDQLPSDKKDEAYRNIISYIITKKLNSEPIFNPLNNPIFGLNYEEISDLLSIIEKIDQDSLIFVSLCAIKDCFDSNLSRISRQQKAEITRELLSIVDRKFPNPKFIKHEGYQIISKAIIYSFNQKNDSDWNDLIKETEKIQNDADRVFIMAYIAYSLPKRLREKRVDLFEKASELTLSLPSMKDQMDRFELISQLAIEIDVNLTKKCLKSGIELSSKRDSSDAYKAQRRFIDLAYKIDPNLAASLASIADDDPARFKAKQNLHQRISTNELKDNISDLSTVNAEPEFDENKLTNAAWLLLGSLNSHRIAPQHFEKVRKYAVSGANSNLRLSYPIYAWLVQNAVDRYKTTDQAASYIRPLFEAIINGCELVQAISRKTSSRSRNLTKHDQNEDSQRSIILENQSKDDAMTLISDWLKDNLGDYLLVADPYFGVEELWLLNMINTINHNCEIQIITSRKHNTKINLPWESEYLNCWKKISDQDPPMTEIIIAGLQSNQMSPIHDRWLITQGKGLSFGSSINSLGAVRISEIRGLSTNEAIEREEVIKKYTVTREKTIKSERIVYSTFTL